MLKTPRVPRPPNGNPIAKCLTGIRGFDEITNGGLPRNKTTLVVGSAGSGKTLWGLDFLINGALDYEEPGVFMSFEESENELYDDVASFNLNLRSLVAEKKILLDCVSLERNDIQEHDFNLEGVLVRLEHAISDLDTWRKALDRDPARRHQSR